MSGTGGIPAIHWPRGCQCIYLTFAANGDADATPATCGSTANYRVIAKAATQDGCVSDVDATYYETRRGTEQGALCLNVDFVVGGCFDLTPKQKHRVTCGTTGPKVVRVTGIKTNTVDKSLCPDATFTYDTQRMVVCLTPQP